jgi:hypothetical protein
VFHQLEVEKHLKRNRRVKGSKSHQAKTSGLGDQRLPNFALVKTYVNETQIRKNV